MSTQAPLPAAFSAALKPLKADARGRINIGMLVSSARGQTYLGAVDPEGRILLTPYDADEGKSS